MKVLLKKMFFGPDGFRYRANSGGTDMPNHLRDKLPKDAVVLDEGEMVGAAPEQPARRTAAKTAVTKKE